MAKTVTPTTVKNDARATAFATLVSVMVATYGEDKVFRIGDSEVAVEVATAPTGEPIYATFSPTVKDYCDRTTKTKTVKAYDATAMAEAYKATCADREKKAEEAAEAKAKKKARDAEAREKAKAARAAKKAEG